MSYKVAVFGNLSGLGKYLYERFCEEFGKKKVLGINRNNSQDVAETNVIDVMVWCGFNTANTITNQNCDQYFADNLEITKWLKNRNIKRWIYISSIDVLNPVSNHSIYAIMKKLHESLVSTLAKKYVIFRCSAMLGRHMRPNTFTKLLHGQPISVTSDSSFSYILHSDIYECIMDYVLSGRDPVWNRHFTLRGSDTITVQEIANHLLVEFKPGKFCYKSLQNIDVSDDYPDYPQRKSLTAITGFLESIV
jgi:nucleoside-diphosphate-sugar epimerase